MIWNGQGEDGGISSAGLPLHPELAPRLAPVSALQRGLGIVWEGFLPPAKTAGKEGEKRSWA